MPPLNRTTRFRLAGHHLDAKRRMNALSSVVGAIGIRDVQGAGVVALHARLEGVTAATIDTATDDGVIVRVMSARGVETLVPVDDVDVFTIGSLPATDESLRARLRPFLPVLDQSGRTATEALDLARDIAREALADGPVDIGVLSGALTRGLPELSPVCRGRCTVEHIDQGLFDLVGESGVWRLERKEGDRLFVPMDEPRLAAEDARAELVRRYLRCYGPSSPAHFAEWCGIGNADAAASFDALDLVEVSPGEFLVRADEARLAAPPKPEGIRILPPWDPYLATRDRDAVITDRAVQKRVWRPARTDGVVLDAGRVVATWRTRKHGDHIEVRVRAMGRLDHRRRAIEREFFPLAEARGASTCEVVAG